MLKAAEIFAEIRGNTPRIENNNAARKVYHVWRVYRHAVLEDSTMVTRHKIMDTGQLAALARTIYEGR